MTTEYLLKWLVEHGEKMRTAQKNYFKATYGSLEKKKYLSESKTAKKEFDNLIFNAKQLIK